MAWIRNKGPQVSPAARSAQRQRTANGNGTAGHEAAKPAVAPTVDVAKKDWFLALKRDLHQQVISKMNLASIGTMKDGELHLEVRRQAEALSQQNAEPLSMAERETLINEVIDETFGLGPLEPLMRDPDVCDILINGPKTIYVERRGRLERSDCAFHDADHVVQVVQRIVSRVGRRVDETCPMVDARLPDGSRLNAIIHPLALGGPLVSIRRFGARPLLVEDLVRNHSVTPEILEFLAACVARASIWSFRAARAAAKQRY